MVRSLVYSAQIAPVKARLCSRTFRNHPRYQEKEEMRGGERISVFGRLFLNGDDVTNLKPHLRAKELFYVRSDVGYSPKVPSWKT